AILPRQKQKKLIMLPSETMIWQPEFTDKTLSRKTGAVHIVFSFAIFPEPHFGQDISLPPKHERDDNVTLIGD
ncbi:hypothetical protein, partial [Escherichia coli]|uniref:hypothetical protein n=1 Tax=Escherichia coli TaxID=562 RepID=UPI001BCA26E1